MLISCWSAKGGVGTTVIASSLGLLLAAREPGGVLLADLAGDIPAVLGLSTDGLGLADWLATGDDVPADALGRLEIEVSASVGVLPRGRGPLPPDRAEVLAALLDQGARPVVADCGCLTGAGDAAEVVALAATRSLLVTRACTLALRRAAALGHRPSGVVVLREPGRAIGRAEIVEILGAPIVADVEVDPAVARAVDAGLLTGARLPRSLVRGLRHAA